jgi:hypothetical protein
MEKQSMIDIAATRGTASGPENFREILDYVQPKPDEVRWQAIPWQTDLWQARRLAAEQGKPIFLWAMNGNPLGCT